MTVGILGKKIGMAQIFEEDGKLIPVSLIEAGPCFVLQVKTPETDGYQAIQLGFSQKKQHKANRPDLGHFQKAGVKPLKFVREIRIGPQEEYKIGQEILVDIFSPGDYVDLTGTSKGKGFQGGIKRWHWKGGPGAHGSMHHRAPGSIGASSFPSRVFKGQHLPGHMGQDKVTVQNLEVVRVDRQNNLLAVKGSVPGSKGSLLVIRKAKKKVRAEKPKKEEPPKEKKAQEKKKKPSVKAKKK